MVGDGSTEMDRLAETRKWENIADQVEEQPVSTGNYKALNGIKKKNGMVRVAFQRVHARSLTGNAHS